MSSSDSHHAVLPRTDAFAHRHLGPRESGIAAMLATLRCKSLDELVEKAMPAAIRWHGRLGIPHARGEAQARRDLQELASRNQIFRSYLGMGYHGTLTPSVIQRNILENPGWYTQYTPYQAEIAQGRLEALLNFQTMVIDLTGLPVANSSLLDESTAAAEAMVLCHRQLGSDAEGKERFFVSAQCHPQTIDVVRTRAEPLGFEVVVGDHLQADFRGCFGALLQYPGTDGRLESLEGVVERIHAAGALAVVATDLLSLTVLRPPGEFGADAVVGSSQRFGMPMGYGGPHAAFLAVREEFKRQIPGRIIGLTIDAAGGPALRLALQTREQHIRRERATSNICTAQVLPAVVASMYAVYHGPEGLKQIAERVHRAAAILARALESLGWKLEHASFFDTLRVRATKARADQAFAWCAAKHINVRDFGDGSLGIALDETADEQDLLDLFAAFGGDAHSLDLAKVSGALAGELPCVPSAHQRKSAYLTHPTFHAHRSETELLRYMTKLQAKDLSLTTSMIPLGSCTMKLNATTEMEPITWPGFAALHPFAPLEQAQGYAEMHRRLEHWLASVTGFAGISLQPNAGSQGEYAGLLVIRAYHRSRGEKQRTVCLIPSSAHGTNPASAALAGMSVVVVACDEKGNIDLADLRAKAVENSQQLAALMVTYPSTHGVFEESIRQVCAIVHEHGGQVYLDGANMNALVGLARPGDLGADVCHLNLHKTFCIPHGGGGPGMGPIGVAKHLVPHLPGHPVVEMGIGREAIGAVSAAPWGSAAILPIPYAYIAMMGPEGLVRATQIAILNANYMAQRLAPHFPLVYTGQNGLVAHECILDLRPLKQSAGIEAVDVAKRLMDYGFHAPTMSWPVAGTLMIEPTESESKEELDRYCDALIAIRAEIRAIEEGRSDKKRNPLKNAPHTALEVTASAWTHPYSREEAAFPAPWTKEHKFWPPVKRVNDAHGDKNLVCACPPIEAYAR
ncbi:MAG: aminomethyl-transferring glycine dehydrogenase [Planctomycetes bacterium]|nr:aminomethyl-transferring glycine dehydrogenase [Planctomycetota bacterium]